MALSGGSGEGWRFKKQRLGLAWLEADGNRGWRKRRGRCPKGWLNARDAHLAADRAMQDHAAALANEAELRRSAAQRAAMVRGLAEDWLHWLARIRGAKPSTVRDYRTLLREPGERYQRGSGTSRGLIMAAFGDMAAAEVTTADVNRFLRSLDAEGFTSRNVNKYRQVLQAMFAYACRGDTLGLVLNPVDHSDKRREAPPAALDYYEVEEVEALARSCEAGAHRQTSAVGDTELAARAAEDRQDADTFRVLFYTGIRVGELLTLRWADVDLAARLLLVRRNLSAGVETEPKGRRHRYVPVSDPALAALARLGSRDDFVGGDDYVVCNRWGRRLDASALRRRYKLGCEVSGLRPVKLHGLRHAAGSISPGRRIPCSRLPRALEAEHNRPLRERQASPGGLRPPEPCVCRHRCSRPGSLVRARRRMTRLDFPITVDVLAGPKTLYRGCPGLDGAAIRDAMRSNFETGRPAHPADLRATVLHMAISMFEDGELVRRLARRRPDRIGTHVARIELRPGLGICLADTGGPATGRSGGAGSARQLRHRPYARPQLSLCSRRYD